LKRVLLPLLAALLAQPLPVAAGEDTAPVEHPLLERAREREIERTKDSGRTRLSLDSSDLREAQHQLQQAHVPDSENCAGSLGAIRFAYLHASVGFARASDGDYVGAAADYRRALACRPRDAELLGALASALFDARDFRGAREANDAALGIDPRSVSANRLAGNLDYVEERWADAIARFRYVAASDEDRVRAGYGQLMYWLAQRRGGIAKPEFVVRTPGEGWPQPLLLYMRGEYAEAELIKPINEGDSDSNVQPNTSTDERLCEALFYVGEDYWARGRPDVARDYFAALVNIKVIYFLEHGLALAEIAKLREKREQPPFPD
jgi:lipoprotein NlpI